jgi:putative ABC transport system permease protein
VAACRVTADLFPALQVSPLLGRVMTDSDDRPGATAVVLIAERLWSRRYGRDPGLLSRRVQIDG